MLSSFEPTLLQASSCSSSLTSTFAFNPKDLNPVLSLTNDNKTIEWVSNITYAWLGIETLLNLFDGKYSLDFKIDSMQNYQLGVGFLLVWEISPGETSCDWGFYGYLGSSESGFSYDPSTGDIVSHTESIAGGLPILKENKGVVSLELDLPKDKEGEAWFVIDGVKTPSVKLPIGAVVRPAACLLRRNQKITLENFKKI